MTSHRQQLIAMLESANVDFSVNGPDIEIGEGRFIHGTEIGNTRFIFGIDEKLKDVASHDEDDDF